MYPRLHLNPRTSESPGRYVRRGVAPVELGDAPGQRPDGRQPADFCGPGEEVRLDDSLETGGVPEGPALPDVDSKGGLHHHADDHAQVGVADEQVVQLLRRTGHLAQRRPQQVEPKLPLYLDGLVVGRLIEKLPQRGDVPLVQRAVGAQVLSMLARLGGMPSKEARASSRSHSKSGSQP